MISNFIDLWGCLWVLVSLVINMISKYRFLVTSLVYNKRVSNVVSNWYKLVTSLVYNDAWKG